jgi:single-strand DNA-binding protein
MSYNKVMLIGNVGQDPSLTFTDSEPHQLSKATFSVATTERHRTRDGDIKQSTEWHRIVVWAPLAKIVDSYVRKGSQIFIEGILRTRTFDKEGQKHFITEVHATNLRLLGKVESESES